MKLEINVNAPDSVGRDKAVVEKLLIEPVRAKTNKLVVSFANSITG